MARAGVLGRAMMAAGVLGLAVIGLFYGDFVRKWQPVPAVIPFHGTLALASNLLLLTLGAGLLMRRTAAASALALAAFLASWILVLHVPSAVAHPWVLSVWGYLCGDLAVAAGALALWTLLAPAGEDPRQATLRRRAVLAARLMLAPCLVVFGLSHLLFAQAMAPLVPIWLPLRTELVYLTGCAHVAAGLALLFGVLPRLAMILEAAMMTSFVVLVDLARALVLPERRPPLTASCFEGAMAGAVWIMAAALALRAATVQAPQPEPDAGP